MRHTLKIACTIALCAFAFRAFSAETSGEDSSEGIHFPDLEGGLTQRPKRKLDRDQDAFELMISSQGDSGGEPDDGGGPEKWPDLPSMNLASPEKKRRINRGDPLLPMDTVSDSDQKLPPEAQGWLDVDGKAPAAGASEPTQTQTLGLLADLQDFGPSEEKKAPLPPIKAKQPLIDEWIQFRKYAQDGIPFTVTAGINDALTKTDKWLGYYAGAVFAPAQEEFVIAVLVLYLNTLKFGDPQAFRRVLDLTRISTSEKRIALLGMVLFTGELAAHGLSKHSFKLLLEAGFQNKDAVRFAAENPFVTLKDPDVLGALFVHTLTLRKFNSLSSPWGVNGTEEILPNIKKRIDQLLSSIQPYVQKWETEVAEGKIPADATKEACKVLTDLVAALSPNQHRTAFKTTFAIAKNLQERVQAIRDKEENL